MSNILLLKSPLKANEISPMSPPFSPMSTYTEKGKYACLRAHDWASENPLEFYFSSLWYPVFRPQIVGTFMAVGV